MVQEKTYTSILFTDLVLGLLSSSDETTKLEASKALTEGLADVKNIANDFKQYMKMDKS